MRRVISIALLATIAATTAHAMNAVLDVNGGEKAWFDEMTFAYPDFVEELFLAFDIDADSYLSRDEIALAVNDDVIADHEGGF